MGKKLNGQMYYCGLSAGQRPDMTIYVIRRKRCPKFWGTSGKPYNTFILTNN